MNPTCSIEYIEIVTQAYNRYRSHLVAYIEKRINDHDAAEDFVQDIFFRLLDSQTLICAATARSYLFLMAGNMVCDYFRRRRCHAEMLSYMYDTIQPVSPATADACVDCKRLARNEWRCVCGMPLQRKAVYIMSRYEGRKISEIAGLLHLRPRTVETHLFMGRREVRSRLKAMGV